MEFFTLIGIVFFAIIAYHMAKSFFAEPKVVEKIVYRTEPHKIEPGKTPPQSPELRRVRLMEIARRWGCSHLKAEDHYITYSGVMVMSENQRESQITYLRNQSKVHAIEQACHPDDTEAAILCGWLSAYHETEKYKKKKLEEPKARDRFTI